MALFVSQPDAAELLSRSGIIAVSGKAGGGEDSESEEQQGARGPEAELGEGLPVQRKLSLHIHEVAGR